MHFFSLVNCDVSFHVPEDCQHDILYWLLNLELFSLPESQSVPTLFSIQPGSGKSIFSPFGKLFGWVLWHINLRRLFNAKSSLYIHIEYIWFGLVGFYGILTFVGYLIQNPFLYKYSVLFQTIQFSVSGVSMSKTVPLRIIQFSKSSQFKCK